MTEDTRTALAIPRLVHDSDGPIEVRSLSARETIVLIEKLVGIGLLVRAEMKAARDDDFMGGTMRILQKYPDQVLGLIEGATDLESGKLGDRKTETLFDVCIAFLEMHEGALNRFFDLKATWDRVAGKVVRRSPSLSISSSAPDGPTQTSNGSPSNGSNSTPERPPSEESPSASSG